MNKYVSGNGFLTEEGKKLAAPLQAELLKLIQNIGAESESELRTVGSIISHIVGNTVADQIQSRK